MYNNVLWLDDRTSPICRRFIGKLFTQLGQYYDEFIQKTDEMPCYYGERPQIGHLAQAAGRCQYISVQDYNVNVSDKLRRGLKNHYVPDLLIYVPARGQEPVKCVFEAKVKYWTSIDPKENRLARIISLDLAEANKQISEHAYEEGRFYCALAGIRIYCTSRTWESLVRKPESYDTKMGGLLDKVQSALDECRKGQEKPNFWWHYIAPHNMIRRVYREEKTAPTFGVFWVGSIKQYQLKYT